MELKEFVANSLTQVIDGISEAQKLSQKGGALINPRGIRIDELGKPLWREDYNDPDFTKFGQILEFDVAVSASESDQAEGKIRVSALVLDDGVGGDVDTSSRTVSRIIFSAPVFSPEQ